MRDSRVCMAAPRFSSKNLLKEGSIPLFSFNNLTKQTKGLRLLNQMNINRSSVRPKQRFLFNICIPRPQQFHVILLFTASPALLLSASSSTPVQPKYVFLGCHLVNCYCTIFKINSCPSPHLFCQCPCCKLVCQ